MSKKNLEISIVTPYRSIFEGTASYVQIPLYDGLAGIQPGHAGMIARLGPGKLTVHSDTTVNEFFVDGGFVDVSAARVAVLAHNAILPADIKLDDLTREKEDLLSRRVAGDDDINERLERMQSIRSRLALVKK